MGPIAHSDRHDGPGLIDELVPGLAAETDDIVVGLEDPVGEPVVAHELPYVLDRVQLGRSGRERQEGDVFGDLQLVGGVPSGLIEDDEAVGPGADLRRDLLEMPLHGLAVASRQHEGGACAALRTDGTEDIGRLGALILGRSGPGAAQGPSSGQLVLLADPRFVLKPNLYRAVFRQRGLERCQLGGEVFLK